MNDKKNNKIINIEIDSLFTTIKNKIRNNDIISREQITDVYKDYRELYKIYIGCCKKIQNENIIDYEIVLGGTFDGFIIFLKKK